ncbi:uncharacterized protein [Ptychodera flava]|uniref:uncharacterized protein n=1 Tax=Ptychodera flava TaxID=63121 RepID=UPI00396A6501
MGLSAVYEIGSSEYRERLQNLGRVAYDALLKNQVRFDTRDIQSADIYEDDDVLRIGLLNREYSSAKLTPNKYWVFTHKTFQEYMAAFYLVKCEKISKTNVLDKVVDSVDLGTLCLFIAGMLGRDAAPLFDILKQRLTSGVQPFYHYMTLGLSCLYETGHPRMFVDLISDEIVRSKIIAFDHSALISKACLEGLTELISHCNEVSAAERSSRPQLIELDLANNFGSHKLLDVLCDSKYFESVMITVLVSEDKNPLTNVALMSLKCLLLRIECQDVTNDFVLDMSNSVHLKQLNIGLFDLDDVSSFAEYVLKNSNLKSMLRLNNTLEYLGLNGQFRAEEMFCGVGQQISRHPSLKCLYSTFSSNGLLAERRQVMAEILEQSLTLTTWHINTEVLISPALQLSEQKPFLIFDISYARWML